MISNVEKYTCECCKGVFEYEEDWTEDDAVDEYEQKFGGNPVEDDAAIVCGDCYEKLLVAEQQETPQ